MASGQLQRKFPPIEEVICNLQHTHTHSFPLRGFDEFYGLLGGGLNFFTKQCGSGRYDWWRGWEPEWENRTHATTLLNNEALRVVDTHLEDPKSPPFFL